MRVLVTGNEGYIGSVLTAVFVAAGHEVVGFDLGVFREVSFVPRVSDGVEQIYKDVRDVTVKDLQGIDAVVHLAGLSNDPVGALDPKLTLEINHVASVRLAELSREAGVRRWLFSSTCSMYGKSGDELVDETSSLDPRTAYAESKALVEHDVLGMADADFEVVMLRNATVFGVSPRQRLDLVVPNLVASGYLTGTVKVLSDGTPWRPLVHVSDVARAFLFLLEADASLVNGEAFNIGLAANTVQIRDVAELVADVVPDTAVSIAVDESPDERSYRVDFSKIERLGWQADVVLLDGVVELYEAYKRNKLSKADIGSDAYVTLKRYLRWQAQGLLDSSLRMRENVSV